MIESRFLSQLRFVLEDEARKKVKKYLDYSLNKEEYTYFIDPFCMALSREHKLALEYILMQFNLLNFNKLKYNKISSTFHLPGMEFKTEEEYKKHILNCISVLTEKFLMIHPTVQTEQYPFDTIREIVRKAQRLLDDKINNPYIPVIKKKLELSSSDQLEVKNVLSDILEYNETRNADLAMTTTMASGSLDYWEQDYEKWCHLFDCKVPEVNFLDLAFSDADGAFQAFVRMGAKDGIWLWSRGALTILAASVISSARFVVLSILRFQLMQAENKDILSQ